MNAALSLLTILAAPLAAGDESGAPSPHWAYRPIERPAPPAVRDVAWLRTPVDAFVLARLEAAGLTPSPRADRRTLARRLFFDLLGLPPSFEEVRRFEADARPDAYERLVDRLLASPAYGERWGRHWLDVARYADTKDLVLLYGRDAIRPYAYTYRDWVVRALNEDLPYDRFVREQLAADAIEPRVASERLAALGFLTLGRLFDNNLPDVYDDQIDVVSRGLLGLTVACARCHDHKYDAVPTEDYYSLYGVFANSVRPIERPLIEAPGDTPEVREFEEKSRALREKIAAHVRTWRERVQQTAAERVGDYLERVATTAPDPIETAVFFMSLSPDQLIPGFIAGWRRHIDTRDAADAVFGAWRELMGLSEDALAAQAGSVVERWLAKPAGTAPGELNALVARELAAAPIASRTDIAAAWSRAFAAARQLGAEAAGPATPASERVAAAQLLELFESPTGPTWFPESSTYLYMPRVPRSEHDSMRLELDKLAVHSPHAPARAMVIVDADRIVEQRVFERGSPSQPGAVVPRRFLRVLSGETRAPFQRGSGRLELAEAITARGNPLTARVIANRVWMHHTGEPLVSTPSDFGARSTPPSHPELLDWLAATLLEDGWSLKRLHRHIVLSSTYAQASADRPACRAADPDNRLLWHARRRRLALEPMRDALLAASGRLDHRMYGRPVDVANDASNRRRTIYGLIDRQNLPGLMRSFDFASPDQSCARRPETTVPQQALFAMNSPFVVEQAKGLASRLDAGAPEARVTTLYRHALAREPSEREVAASLTFIEAASAEEESLDAWAQLAQIVLMTNEMVFID